MYVPNSLCYNELGDEKSLHLRDIKSVFAPQLTLNLEGIGESFLFHNSLMNILQTILKDTKTEFFTQALFAYFTLFDVT